RPRHVVLTIAGVVALAAIVDPLAVYLARALHIWLGVPWKFFTDGTLAHPDWLTSLSRMYALSMDRVTTFVSMAPLSMVYIVKTTRTSEALASAQLRLSETQRRSLVEELRAAQAAMDPALVFGTLHEVDKRVEQAPHVAQSLLDALIRYLRAALPASDADV